VKLDSIPWILTKDSNAESASIACFGTIFYMI